MSRRISIKKYIKKTRKTRKNKKVYLNKKQSGSGKIFSKIIEPQVAPASQVAPVLQVEPIAPVTSPQSLGPSALTTEGTNIYSNLNCKEVIIHLGRLDKNAVNLVNWQELNNSPSVNVNITDDVHLLDAVGGTLCSKVTNEFQRNYCKEFYNKCKLLYLYRRFIGEYNNELVGVDVLRTIMKNTIPHNDVAGIQNFLIQLGANFTEIPPFSFANRNLTSVTIPNSVQRIGAFAFENNRLKNVTIPNSVQIIGHFAFGNNQLGNVTIPNSVQTIGPFAFVGNQLINVTIPNSVQIIGTLAFTRNRLKTVTLPLMHMGITREVFSEQSNITSTYGTGIRFTYT
jgi:hypothetical protein